jgi:acyl-coenzyme A synthetase/AMP-(fatty) acid ligase
MSEVSTYVSASPAAPRPPGTAGYPQPGRWVAVLGEDGRRCRVARPGELAIGRATIRA